MKSPFFKYSGLGNDFVLLPTSRSLSALNPTLWSERARAACHRHEGIGADGLILFHSRASRFEMAVINPDGSFATMCGNATRCAVRHYLATVATQREIRFRYIYYATARSHYVDCTGIRAGKNAVTVEMPLVVKITGPHRACGHSWYYVFSGTDHIVTFLNSSSRFDHWNLASLGPLMRAHRYFQPSGTNVNLVVRSGEDAFRLRTFERGVEAETLACGTGSIAAVLADMHTRKLTRLTKSVLQSGGDTLHISCEIGSQTTLVRQTGGARCVFEGHYDF